MIGGEQGRGGEERIVHEGETKVEIRLELQSGDESVQSEDMSVEHPTRSLWTVLTPQDQSSQEGDGKHAGSSMDRVSLLASPGRAKLEDW